MPKVRVLASSVSVDGFAAGPRQDLENPLGVNGPDLMRWFFPTRTFRSMNEGPDAGGETARAHPERRGVLRRRSPRNLAYFARNRDV